MKIMSEGAKKAGVAGLAVALAVTTAISASAFGSAKAYATSDATTKTETQKSIESNYPNLLAGKDYSGIVAKDETTYVVMDADGNVTDTVVSEWLRNGKGEKSISDTTTLKKIKNTSGKEKFKQDGNEVTWAADGNDITYEGTPTEELPISVKVTYYLDGEKISAKDLAGKSGKVEIHFDYTINKMETVSVNGSSYRIPHPYTMASGLVLDNSHFTNVQISNGKAINDGDKTICLGIAFPGMSDALKLNLSSVNIPESVVVTANATDFTLDGTYTVAMSESLAGADLSTGSLNDKMKELEDGIQQLSDASDELVSGTAKLKEGSAQALEAYEGKGGILEGALQLNSALKQMATAAQPLVAGSNQMQEAIFNMATQQLQATLVQNGMTEAEAKAYVLTKNNYKQVLNGISSAALQKADATIRAGLAQNGVTDTAQQNLLMARAYNQLATAGNLTPTQAQVLEAVTAAGTEAATAQKVSAATSNQAWQAAAVQKLTAATQAQNPDATFDPTTAENQDKIAVLCVEMLCVQAGGVADPTQCDLATLGTTQAKALQLISTAKTFAAWQSAEGSNTATDAQNLAAMAAGGKATTDALKSTEKQLDEAVAYTEGVKSLVAYVQAASTGSGNLLAGLQKYDKEALQPLNKGINELADGMTKFDEEGIDKMLNSLDETQLTDVLNRAQAMQQASDKPVFLGGVKSGMAGDSKIIFKTGSVEK